MLVGVALNWAGAVKLAREVWPADRSRELASDYQQLKAFTAGTAATFGAFYLYLRQQRVVPLLVFGASLKTWAFVLSAVLRIERRLGRRSFISFGVSNGIVAALFWAHMAGALRNKSGAPAPG